MLASAPHPNPLPIVKNDGEREVRDPAPCAGHAVAATDNSWRSYPAATAATVSYTANNLDQYAVGAVTPLMTATATSPSTAP